MNLNFQLGLERYYADDYYEALDFFRAAYKQGHDRIESLYHISLCNFYIAACHMTGTGILSGFSRRTVLLHAKNTLQECVGYPNTDAQVLNLLCQIDYAVGLISHGNNGYSKTFNEYFEKLECLDYALANELKLTLPSIENAFRI